MTNQSKRKLIKVLTAGGGAAFMADRWVKPVVKSTILPAHAQMSGIDEPQLSIQCSSPTSAVVQDSSELLSVTVTVIPAPTSGIQAPLLCNGVEALASGIPLANFAGGTSATVSVAAPNSAGSLQCPVGGVWELRAIHPLDSNITASCTWDVLQPPPPPPA